MATKRPARASPELREAPLSPRYHPELHHPMGHCCGLGLCAKPVTTMASELMLKLGDLESLRLG